MEQGKEKERDKEKQEKAGRLAYQVLRLAQDSLLVHLRFLDAAIARLKPMEKPGLGGVAIEDGVFYYDPSYVLRCYRQEPNTCARFYLHGLLHCIFFHSFAYEKMEAGLWDLATDLAVENTILQLEMSVATVDGDLERRQVLEGLRREAGGLTAEWLYRYFRQNPLETAQRERLCKLFYQDSHVLWRKTERQERVISQEMWKKLSERIRADLKSFSAGKTKSESLQENLEEAVRERYDYGELLRRFTVMGETLRVNEEEFDYIYYTYGLARYGNLPLIEPLEYREDKRVREFAIVLDTSASCRGPLLRAFLRKTWAVLRSSESFFAKVNIHIIQCDHEVRNDTKLCSQEDFETFLREGTLSGFGSTDFRPAFTYVEGLLESGEFENLKGLIYFTDGYGVYPQRPPGYDVIFAFLDVDGRRPETPSWAIKVILEKEELERDEY